MSAVLPAWRPVHTRNYVSGTPGPQRGAQHPVICEPVKLDRLIPEP